MGQAGCGDEIMGKKIEEMKWAGGLLLGCTIGK
jgi:hypothetical protein